MVKSYWQKETDDLQGKRERSTGGRPDFIQFDATTNKGNSGGPVVNFDGSLIGLAALKSTQEEGANWAIPVDRIRMFMPYLIPAEEIGGFEVGLEVDMLADDGRVLNVLEGSSAWDAGIRSGDVIQQIDNSPIRQGHEWLIALWGRKLGDKVSVAFSNASKTSHASLDLRAATVLSTVSLADKTPGVQYQLYDGLFPSIPDYNELKPIRQGVVDKVDLNLVNTSDKRSYSIVYSGYIEFPEAGLVRIGIGSDDGSKLYLNNQLLIDNDLAHGFAIADSLGSCSSWPRAISSRVYRSRRRSRSCVVRISRRRRQETHSFKILYRPFRQNQVDHKHVEPRAQPRTS